MVENASLFLAYGELQNAVRALTGLAPTHALSLPQLALAAGGAGAITSFLLCVPIDGASRAVCVRAHAQGPG